MKDGFLIQAASATRILVESAVADATIALVLFRELTTSTFAEPICVITLTRVTEGKPRVLHTFSGEKRICTPPLPPLPFEEDRPLAEAPKDGRTILARDYQHLRWAVYKPGAPAHLLRQGGRWQRMNAYGGWENMEELPATYVVASSHPAGIAPTSTPLAAVEPA